MSNVSSDANLEAWNQWCPSTTSYHNNVVPSSPIEWQSLPEELVMMILDKLLERIDYVRFAAVCKEWYRLVKDKYTRDTDRWYHRRRPPKLLLPPLRGTQTLGRRTLCSIVQGTIYNNIQLQVPHPTDDDRDCCDSGHGWLAIVSKGEYHQRFYLPDRWHIELVNPFWCATTLTLPLVHLTRWRRSAPKVILSSDPALNPYNFWVLAFFKQGSSLAIHKRGEDDWTLLKINGAYFTDAIFYNGSFYAIDNWHGCILQFDVEEFKSRVLSIGGFERNQGGRSYLVESTKGDLLCIKRNVKSKGPFLNWGYETTSFKVYKLEFDNQSSSTVTMVDVADIEDETLFVGDTPSVSVLASNFCGCQPNSIYYTDDSFNYPPPRHFEDIPRHYPQGITFDIGVFNITDKTILPYNGRHFSPPVWITTPALPFDPVPRSNLTEWTSSNSFELKRARARASKVDTKKSRLKHWLSCFPSKK